MLIFEVLVYCRYIQFDITITYHLLIMMHKLLCVHHVQSFFTLFSLRAKDSYEIMVVILLLKPAQYIFKQSWLDDITHYIHLHNSFCLAQRCEFCITGQRLNKGPLHLSTKVKCIRIKAFLYLIWRESYKSIPQTAPVCLVYVIIRGEDAKLLASIIGFLYDFHLQYKNLFYYCF